MRIYDYGRNGRCGHARCEHFSFCLDDLEPATESPYVVQIEALSVEPLQPITVYLDHLETVQPGLTYSVVDQPSVVSENLLVEDLGLGRCGHARCRKSSFCWDHVITAQQDVDPNRFVIQVDVPTSTPLTSIIDRLERPDLERSAIEYTVVDPTVWMDTEESAFVRRGSLVDGDRVVAVWECGTCGALVPQDRRIKHRNWHS